jgi:tail assembly chaperone
MAGWSPEAFWRATLFEISATIDGFIEFNSPAKDDVMSRDELEELKEKYG